MLRRFAWLLHGIGKRAILKMAINDTVYNRLEDLSKDYLAEVFGLPALEHESYEESDDEGKGLDEIDDLEEMFSH